MVGEARRHHASPGNGSRYSAFEWPRSPRLRYTRNQRALRRSRSALAETPPDLADAAALQSPSVAGSKLGIEEPAFFVVRRVQLSSFQRGWSECLKLKGTGEFHKPNSVPVTRRQPVGPSICDRRCRRPKAIYPEARRLASRCRNGRSGLASLFDLAPHGVCRAPRVTTRAVRSYRTLSPLPGSPEG